MNRDREFPEEPALTAPPYVHLAFINAIHLSPYALKPLEPTTGRSAWQLSLEKLIQLPHRQLKPGSGLPCVCLLPPRSATLPRSVAEALEPQRLCQQGLQPLHLQDYTETALLTAVRQGIEVFYPQAFRPDATVKALEKYLDYFDKHELPAQSSKPDSSQPFGEEACLPLAMYFGPEQRDTESLPLPENLNSRQIHCYWIEGDAPLLSLELIEQLYHKHHRYAAELSFSDLYPQGLVPVLFQAAALGRLWLLKRESPKSQCQASTLNTNSLNIWGIAERDLNLFAAEPLLCAKDYRLLRLDLRTSNKRQYQILQDLCRSLWPVSASKGCCIPVAKVLQWVESSAQSLRSLPRYFPIQISAFCPQQCSYCPYPQIVGCEFFPPQALRQNGSTGFMPRQLWRSLLAAIAEFAGDGVIGLSPLGEPLLHPEFVGLVEDLQQYPSLELVIETSGSHWEAESIRQLRGQITWIVSLDALDPKLYRQLRAPNENISPLTGMTASQQKAHDLVELLLDSGQSVYVQAVRMEENEADLEAFYRYWAEGCQPSRGHLAQALRNRPKPQSFPQVIVQKYNSYAGLLPERQLLRLAPVERFPCRRLAREMVFGLDGRAYLCVQDLQQKLAGQLKLDLGHFPQQSLEELWHCGHSLYQQHVDGHYPSICQKCDEYYAYNF